MTKIKYIHQKNNKSTTGEGAVMLMFYWNSERRFIKLLCALKCLSCKLVWLFCLSQLWRNNWRAHPNFSFHIYQCDSQVGKRMFWIVAFESIFRILLMFLCTFLLFLSLHQPHLNSWCKRRIKNTIIVWCILLDSLYSHIADYKTHVLYFSIDNT